MMKRRTLLVLIIFFIMILIALLTGSVYLYARNYGSIFSSSLKPEPGYAEVYFCPKDNCDRVFLDFISSSTKSIHCAIYELSLDNVTDILDGKDKVVDVSILIDEEEYGKVKSHSFIHPIKRSGIMHNKFCIVDGNITLTGSFNPTTTADQNDNNILVIRSQSIARNYEHAFDVLNGHGRPRALKQEVRLENITLKNYFCPADKCEEKVVKELSRARQSIYFMTFSFTSDAIGDAVMSKHSAELSVKGIFEKSQISEYSEFERMNLSGIDVILDKNPKSMHHKVFIIDNSTVITGSFNPSRNADQNNDENIVVIMDEGTAREYAEEFFRLYTGRNK